MGDIFKATEYVKVTFTRGEDTPMCMGLGNTKKEDYDGKKAEDSGMDEAEADVYVQRAAAFCNAAMDTAEEKHAEALAMCDDFIKDWLNKPVKVEAVAGEGDGAGEAKDEAAEAVAEQTMFKKFFGGLTDRHFPCGFIGVGRPSIEIEATSGGYSDFVHLIVPIKFKAKNIHLFNRGAGEQSVVQPGILSASIMSWRHQPLSDC